MRRVACVCLCPGREAVFARFLATLGQFRSLDGWELIVSTQGFFGLASLRGLFAVPGAGSMVKEYFHNPYSVGVCQARLDALRHASAGPEDVVLMLDDDMEFLPETKFELGVSLTFDYGTGLVIYPSWMNHGLAKRGIEKLKAAANIKVNPVSTCSQQGGVMMSGAVAGELLDATKGLSELPTVDDIYFSGLIYVAGYQNYRISEGGIVHLINAKRGTGYLKDRITRKHIPMPSDLFISSKDTGSDRMKLGYIDRGFYDLNGYLYRYNASRCLTAHATELHFKNRLKRFGLLK